MTDIEQIKFIILHLGFKGATHTLRVPKDRVPKLLSGEQPFTINIKSFAKKTVISINQLLLNQPCDNEFIADLYHQKRGVTL